MPAVEAVMQNQLDQMSLFKMFNDAFNLMFSNDEHTRIICKSCGDEIVHMIRQHGDQSKVLRSGLRALGRLFIARIILASLLEKVLRKLLLMECQKQDNEETFY